MPVPRLSIDALLALAPGEAQRLAAADPKAQPASPHVAQAVEQVWALVKARLGDGPEVRSLDALIARITRREV